MSVSPATLPFGPRLRRALAAADALARRRGTALLDVEHVFLVLGDQSGSIVRTIVARAGYDPGEFWEKCREAVRQHPLPVVRQLETFGGGEGI